MRSLLLTSVVVLLLSSIAHAELDVEQVKGAVKTCVEATNALGGRSDAFYNPATQAVHIGVATPMWKFNFDKCMTERGFPPGPR
jgi:hypothetical protein